VDRAVGDDEVEDLLLAFIYFVAAASVILVVLALGFIDVGLVRRKNALDTWIAKITAAFIGAILLSLVNVLLKWLVYPARERD